jgi:DNA-binding transcriptional MerR regulator
VGELARWAGVTVRTLHHWDAVGLLVPSGRTSSGYRVYCSRDLERLVQVLAYRELGLPLGDVRRLLDEPDTDVEDLLRAQHELLLDRIGRLQDVAALVQTARGARRMGIELTPQEVREVFGDDDPTRHAQEAQERWGETPAYAQSAQRTSHYGKQDWERIVERQGDLEERFARALRDGLPADGEQARRLAEEHRAFLSAHFYEVDAARHRDLADLYVTDGRFTAHYDDRQPGLAQYVHDAVHACAEP